MLLPYLSIVVLPVEAFSISCSYRLLRIELFVLNPICLTVDDVASDFLLEPFFDLDFGPGDLSSLSLSVDL